MQERVYIVQTPVRDASRCETVTGDLKRRLIDTWESLSQNAIDEAVGYGDWTKWLRANMRQKDITLSIC